MAESEETEKKVDFEAEDKSTDDATTSTPTIATTNAIEEDGQEMVGEEEEEMEEEEEEEEPLVHPLDVLTDQEVIELLEEMEAEKVHLELENYMFEEFLKNNDASLLEGFEAIVENIIAKMNCRIESLNAPPVEGHKKIVKSASRSSLCSIILDGRGPKVNITQKMEMVLRHIEDMQASLASCVNKARRTRRNLRSELEEFSIREAEIKEAKCLFEFSVVTQGMDPLTQRIPAEKFVKYMEDWLKASGFNIEKLRLRTASLKQHYQKVSGILVQRQELGENVHAVDFDQLEIENKHFMIKIDQKNLHLLELKRMNGAANLVLSKHKKYLQQQQHDHTKLQGYIHGEEKSIKEIENECEQEEEELKKTQEKFDYFKGIKSMYKVPDVMEYINIKRELNEMKKNIKIWVRKKKILDIGLNASIKLMQNLTGKNKIDPEWFEDLEEVEAEDLFVLKM